MAKFRQLQKKISSIKSTVKITRAMELVAASRIAKAQLRLSAAKPYATVIHEAIGELAGASEVAAEFPLLKPRASVKTVGLLVITSDRGLAGAYNSSVLRLATQQLRGIADAGQTARVHASGKKGIGFFKFGSIEMASTRTGVSDQPSYEDAETIGELLVHEFESEQVDEVRLVYTAFESAGRQVPTVKTILPIARDDIESENQAQSLYEFDPSPAEILSLLLPRYINTVIYGAMLDSAASEHASRRRAMKSATENGEDLAKLYTRIANRERQAEITGEIMEVVGGAEALKDDDDD
ncbi:MAG: F0F1 ATP synthase subunit gamma [Actinomycetota bacterium]